MDGAKQQADRYTFNQISMTVKKHIEVTHRNPDYFINLYYEYCKKYRTGQEAYEAVEAIYRKYTLIRRYRNYDVFRIILTRHNRNK